MKIGHLSDIHILDIDTRNPLHFLNKRLVGGLNLLLHRGKTQSSQVVSQALRQLDALGVDHIAVSGDLSNLALDSEFRAAKRLLEQVDDSVARISVVPGNHDYYTHEAVDGGRFEKHFQRYIMSDLPDYQSPSGYPYCKLRDNVAIIGMSSAMASPWLFATGKVPAQDLENTKYLFDDPLVKDKFKVVIIHHHLVPFKHSNLEYNRRLINARQILNVFREHQVDLVLHGHNHHYSIEEVPHLVGDGKVRICDAGSAAKTDYTDPEYGGKFNIYHIENKTLTHLETYLYDSRTKTFNFWNEVTFDT